MGPVVVMHGYPWQTHTIRQQTDRLIKTVCEEVGCENWAKGWTSAIDESTQLGQSQAFYIRHQSGRTHREHRSGDGLTYFSFESGQRCFAEHQTMPQRFLIVDGDYSHKRGIRRDGLSGPQWIDDLLEGHDRLATSG